MIRSRVARIQAANAILIADGKLDSIGEFFTTDYVAHLTDSELAGHDGIRKFLRALRRSFPDIQVAVEVLAAGKKRIAWQRRLQGTHAKDFMGFPASGRKIVWRDMLTSEFRDGLIAEEWAISDLAERLLRARKR